MKTRREVRKENRDEGKILRDLGFIFDPERDYYKPKKTASAFNNNYIQYESMEEIKTKSICQKIS